MRSLPLATLLSFLMLVPLKAYSQTNVDYQGYKKDPTYRELTHCQKKGHEDCFREGLAFAREYVKFHEHMGQSPFLSHAGEKTDYAVVLLHGMGMSPHQMRPMMNFLSSRKMNVINIPIPGYSTHQNLDPRAYYTNQEEVLSELDTALRIAKSMGNKVILGGTSYGGLIAFHHALKNPESISALISISPAFRSTYSGQEFSCLGKFLGRSKNISDFILDKIGIANKEMALSNISHVCIMNSLSRQVRHFENKNIRDKTRFMDRTKRSTFRDSRRRQLVGAQLKVPTFIAYGSRDWMVDSTPIDHYAKGIKTEKLIYKKQTRDHMIENDRDVLRKLGHFLHDTLHVR